MTKRRGECTYAAWVAVVATMAFASTASAAKHRPRVVVLDFPNEQAFQGNANKALNEFFASDLRQQGFDVITSADVAAVLGVEKQKELLGCSDGSCMADLGGAMGSDYVARGTIAVLEDVTALSLSLQDSHGAEVNRVSAKVPSKTASALLTKIEEMVPQLVQPLRDAGKLGTTPAMPTTPSTPATTTPAVSTPAPAASTDAPVLAYTLLGVGGAVGIAGACILGYGLQQSAQGQADTNAHLNTSMLGSPQQTGSQMTAAGGVAIGVGVVVAGVGTYFLLTSGHHGSEATPASTHAPTVTSLLLDFQ